MKITIATVNGPRKIEAAVFGQYAVHRLVGSHGMLAPLNHEWTVTHRPTGVSFYAYAPELTMIEATAIAVRLNDARIKATSMKIAGRRVIKFPFSEEDSQIIMAIIGEVLGCEEGER